MHREKFEAFFQLTVLKNVHIHQISLMKKIQCKF